MAIPGTALLSLFPGPAEDPLSEGGKWAQVNSSRNPLKKGVNFATDSAHGDPNYSYWTPEAFYGSDAAGSVVEVWGCSSGGQLGAALETWRLALWVNDPSAVNGYQLYFGGGISKAFVLRRYSGSFASFVDIAGVGGGYPTQMMLRINGPTIEGWGWFGSGDWQLMVSVNDTTFRGYFYLGLGIEDPTAGGLSWTCFGGGKPRRTQIYRILPALT